MSSIVFNGLVGYVLVTWSLFTVFTIYYTVKYYVKKYRND